MNTQWVSPWSSVITTRGPPNHRLTTPLARGPFLFRSSGSADRAGVSLSFSFRCLVMSALACAETSSLISGCAVAKSYLGLV
jgi:hypothetical protein